MADDEDDTKELRERLLSHSTCFNSLLGLIPAKYYFPDNEEEKSNKFYKNKGHKAPKQAVKEATKKAKLNRLHPKQHKTVPEIQEENSRPKENGHIFSVEDVSCSNLGDLHSKLQARIELLRKKRKAPTALPDHRPITKRRKKDTKGKKRTKAINSAQINSKPALNHKKNIVNEQGTVVFSKFDFTSDVRKMKDKDTGKKKDYKKLLEKAESRKKKLEEIKHKGDETSKEVLETVKWKKALGKSEGVKQKDDPALLKKAMKRKEKAKRKHQKEWNERAENQRKQMKERQERRQKNIQDRIDMKKKKKSGRIPGF
ncbi:ribosomal RNA-processing protein 14-C-like [Xenia sp. Carnegie-2017]|uniref:ribosomal RNA-processing protein 14-C-like n=1 Tax=Xenia sp. Carnegie-2017 TaxID=2897299 RepID=UPI001F048DB9|nr:ribosomal RNA-processing protein 14-C-like [Xenia sp. Carnegie-2017]